MHECTRHTPLTADFRQGLAELGYISDQETLSLRVRSGIQISHVGNGSMGSHRSLVKSDRLFNAILELSTSESGSEVRTDNQMHGDVAGCLSDAKIARVLK